MESFDNSAKNSLSFLDNQYVSAGVVLLLILYAGMAAPRLPKCIRNIFDYTLFKLVFFFLVAYMFMVNRDPIAALIAAVAILIVLQAFNISSTMEPMSSLSEEENGSRGWVCACGRMHSPVRNGSNKRGVSLSEEEHALVQEGKQMMMDGKKLISKGRNLIKNGNNGGEQLINDGKALMNAGKMQIKLVVQRRNPVSEEAMNMMEEGRQMMEEGQQLMEEGRTEEGQQLMEEAQQLVEECQQMMEMEMEEEMQMGEENTMEAELPMYGGAEMEETQLGEENFQEMTMEEIRSMMEEGKRMMEQGRRLIQEEGRTEEGKRLMEEGRSLVEEIKQMIDGKRSEMEIYPEMPYDFTGGMESLPEESLSELSEMEAEQASMEERVSMVVEEVNKQRKKGKKLNKNQIKALCSRVNDEFNFDKPTLVELWKQYRPALIQPEIPPNGIIEGGMPGSASGSQYATVMN